MFFRNRLYCINLIKVSIYKMTNIEDQNPFDLFNDWLREAEESEPNDPSAVALATANKDGQPSVRMVLLKEVDENGFIFYTNIESNKGHDLAENPKAAMLFHWKSLRRQIRIEGTVTRVSDTQADNYYQSRDRQSRIGAWASQQSRPLESRFALEKAVAMNAAKYAIGDIPRPEYWSGFRITPARIEFWKDGAFRLHDRHVFTKGVEDSQWQCQRLYP